MKRLLYIVLLSTIALFAQESPLSALTGGHFVGWKSIIIPASSITRDLVSGAVGYPERDTLTGALMFDKAAAETCAVSIVIPNDYMNTDSIFVHYVWQGTTADTGDVYWNFKYQWADIDSVQETAATLTSLDTIGTAEAAVGAVIKYTDAMIVTGAGGKTVNSMALLTALVTRAAANAWDTYDYDAKLYAIVITYKADPTGSDYRLRR